MDSNTKRAGNYPTRLCKFNRFYPANKTFSKDTTNFMICQEIIDRIAKNPKFFYIFAPVIEP